MSKNAFVRNCENCILCRNVENIENMLACGKCENFVKSSTEEKLQKKREADKKSFSTKKGKDAKMMMGLFFVFAGSSSRLPHDRASCRRNKFRCKTWKNSGLVLRLLHLNLFRRHLSRRAYTGGVYRTCAENQTENCSYGSCVIDDCDT